MRSLLDVRVIWLDFERAHTFMIKEEILCGNQAEILTAEELPCRGYMEDTRETAAGNCPGAQPVDSGGHWGSRGQLRFGGAMIVSDDFHGADLIALLFAFMVLYSGVVAVLTDK